LEVRESVVGFKVAFRLFVGWLDMTLGKGRVPGGVNRGLLENSAVGMKLIRKPSQVGLPTSVGFATSAHAKCAFLVLQKISRDWPLLKTRWAPGRWPCGHQPVWEYL